MKKLLTGAAVAACGLIALTGCGDREADQYQREMDLGANCAALGGAWYWVEIPDTAQGGRYICEMFDAVADLDQELPPIHIYTEEMSS